MNSYGCVVTKPVTLVASSLSSPSSSLSASSGLSSSSFSNSSTTSTNSLNNQSLSINVSSISESSILDNSAAGMSAIGVNGLSNGNANNSNNNSSYIAYNNNNSNNNSNSSSRNDGDNEPSIDNSQNEENSDDIKSLDSILDIDELKRMLQHQLEYYFSRENLSRDTYLLTQMDSDQYVQISTVANFDQVKRLTRNMRLIIDALKASPCVQVDEAEEKVRPINKRCVLILREIADSTPIKEIEEIFTGTQCPKFISCEFAHNNSWYVTFESDEDAQRAYRYLREEVKTFQGKPIMARIKAKPVIQSFVNFKNGIRPNIPGHGIPNHLRLPNAPAENFNPVVQNQNSLPPRVSYPNVPPNYPPFYHPPPILQAWSPPATCYDLSQVFAINGLLPAPSYKTHTSGRFPSYQGRIPSRSRGPNVNRNQVILSPNNPISSVTPEQTESPTPGCNDQTTISNNAIEQSVKDTGISEKNCPNLSNIPITVNARTSPKMEVSSVPQQSPAQSLPGVFHSPYTGSRIGYPVAYEKSESSSIAATNNQSNYNTKRRTFSDHVPRSHNSYVERTRENQSEYTDNYGQSRLQHGHRTKSRSYNSTGIGRKKRSDTHIPSASNKGNPSGSANSNYDNCNINNNNINNNSSNNHNATAESQQNKQKHDGASHKNTNEGRLQSSVEKAFDLQASSFPPLPGIQRETSKSAQSTNDNVDLSTSSCLADVVKGTLKSRAEKQQAETLLNLTTDSSDTESCTNASAISVSESEQISTRTKKIDVVDFSSPSNSNISSGASTSDTFECINSVTAVNVSTSSSSQQNLNINAITPAKILTPPLSPASVTATTVTTAFVPSSKVITNQRSETKLSKGIQMHKENMHDCPKNVTIYSTKEDEDHSITTSPVPASSLEIVNDSEDGEVSLCNGHHSDQLNDECKCSKDDSECSSISYTNVSDYDAQAKKLSYCEVAKLSKNKLAQQEGLNGDNNNNNNNNNSNNNKQQQQRYSVESPVSTSSVKSSHISGSHHRQNNRSAFSKEKERDRNRFGEKQSQPLITRQKESRREQREKLSQKDSRPSSRQNSFHQRTRDRLYTE